MEQQDRPLEPDHCCPWWFAYTFDNALRRLFQKPEAILAPWLEEGMTALDLGCGMGYYSIAMAKMVGPSGRVVSVDLQRKMLEVMKKRAARKGVVDRIEPVRASRDDIRFCGQVDFALAMWMMHEVISKDKFLEQVWACLKEGARFLVAEPSFHVSREVFEAELKLAEECGFSMSGEPKVGVSHAALLEKRSDQ